MAAEYGININVRTRTQALKKLQTDLKAVNQQYAEIQNKIKNDNKLKDLNKQKNRALADEAEKLKSKIILQNNAFLNSTDRINSNSKSLKLLSQQLLNAQKSTRFLSSEYKVLAQGIQKADFTAQFKQLKEFSRTAAFTARNFGGNIQFARGDSIADALAFRPANTTNAMQEYVKFLKDLQVQLDRTGKEFKEVTLRIKEMENDFT